MPICLTRHDNDVIFPKKSLKIIISSMIIVRKKQKIQISYFHFFKSCFTLRTSILINESITMFGYSIQSSQINCSSALCFLTFVNILFSTYCSTSPFQPCKEGGGGGGRGACKIFYHQ